MKTCKIGKVNWVEVDGLWIPEETVNMDIDQDHEALNKVFWTLRTSKKSPPAMSLIQSIYWHNWEVILPLLRRSFEQRVDACYMSNEWDLFWLTLTNGYVRKHVGEVE